MHISLSKILVRVADRTLFKIPRGEIKTGTHLLIKGASGRGKTTFLHLLAGLFQPDEGTISIGETELTQLQDEDRARFRRAYMGLVFQKLNLIEHLTALENIQLSLKIQNDTQAALDALNSVGLKGREHDRTAVLSLGEQQRVAVARVLASDPLIILADEPTSSLDEKNALEVTQLLVKASAGKTLIVVSHDHRIEKFFTEVRDFGEWTA